MFTNAKKDPPQSETRNMSVLEALMLSYQSSIAAAANAPPTGYIIGQFNPNENLQSSQRILSQPAQSRSADTALIEELMRLLNQSHQGVSGGTMEFTSQILTSQEHGNSASEVDKSQTTQRN
jgi:hypothetical protein